MGLRHFIKQHPARAGTVAGWYHQVCGALAAFAVVPFILKALSPVDAGLWFSFQGLLWFVNLADFGLSFVIVRQVAYSLHARSDALTKGTDFLATRRGWAGVSDVYATSRRLFQWVAATGIVTLAVLFHLVLPLGKVLHGITPQITLTWYLLGSATIVSLVTRPHLALLEGVGRIYLTRFLAGTAQLLTGAGVIFALILGARLLTMACVVCAVSLVQYAAARVCVRLIAGHNLTPVVELPSGLLRACLRVGAPMGLLGVGALLVSYVQVPMIAFFLGPQQVVGFYLAQRIGQTVNQLVMQLIVPQFPLFTHELAAENFALAGARLKRSVLAVSGLAVFANAAFFLLSPVIVDRWVGAQKYVDRPVLLLMSIDYFMMSAAVVWGQFVLASGKNPFVFATFASGALNMILCVALLPKLGLAGLPLATLIAGLMINYWLNPLLGWNLYRRLRPPGQPPAAIYSRI